MNFETIYPAEVQKKLDDIDVMIASIKECYEGIIEKQQNRAIYDINFALKTRELYMSEIQPYLLMKVMLKSKSIPNYEIKIEGDN